MVPVQQFFEFALLQSRPTCVIILITNVLIAWSYLASDM